MSLSKNIQEIINEWQFLTSLRALRRQQWQPRTEMFRLQLKRVQALVRYAYTHVLYYHRLLDAVAFNPDDLRRLDDLAKIPVTKRSTVNRYHSAFLADNVTTPSTGHWWEGKTYTRNYTSGSSGATSRSDCRSVGPELLCSTDPVRFRGVQGAAAGYARHHPKPCDSADSSYVPPSPVTTSQVD